MIQNNYLAKAHGFVSGLLSCDNTIHSSTMLCEDHSIFLLGEKDIPALLALERANFLTTWSEGQYRAILQEQSAAPFAEFVRSNALGGGIAVPALVVFGLFDAGKNLIGYVSLGLNQAGAELEIFNIAVAAATRRQGLGKKLLAHVLACLARHGMLRVFLEVAPSNTAALALYASLGFSACGRRKAYYANGEDALILAYALDTRFEPKLTECHNETAHGSQLEDE